MMKLLIFLILTFISEKHFWKSRLQCFSKNIIFILLIWVCHRLYKTTHVWTHLAANILEVFADGCEEWNTAVFCSLTAVIWLQTSPALRATLMSIWTTKTQTEQTSRQRQNCLPLALTDHRAHKDLLQTLNGFAAWNTSVHTWVNSYQAFEAPVAQ